MPTDPTDENATGNPPEKRKSDQASGFWFWLQVGLAVLIVGLLITLGVVATNLNGTLDQTEGDLARTETALDDEETKSAGLTEELASASDELDSARSDLADERQESSELAADVQACRDFAATADEFRELTIELLEVWSSSIYITSGSDLLALERLAERTEPLMDAWFEQYEACTVPGGTPDTTA